MITLNIRPDTLRAPSPVSLNVLDGDMSFKGKCRPRPAQAVESEMVRVQTQGYIEI